MAQAGEPTITKHVVVAQEAHAADVGWNVLRAGGNAIDAAVATAFALAVTVPEAGNLGGGGFLVAYLADRREVVTVDFRETAPRSASPRMYL
ncbi:MAG: gamma-glutamyltransferase, partial [Isosphaeraceae bacterium]